MRTALLVTSLALVVGAIPGHAQEPTIKVRLNKHGNVEQGDRVRVYARAETDGYLVVLHAEPDGRVRVLFPLDPFDDNFVRGARDVEIRGRGDREAFRVYDSTGEGTVFAAFSRDPFQFAGFVKDDHWDYEVLDTWRLTPDRDPEAELTALVDRMTPNTTFTYDLTKYLVYSRYASSSTYYPSNVYTYWNVGWNPWWGWNVGISHGFGWWDPWSPYWYDPWYAPYGWRSAYWYSPYYYYPAYYYRPLRYYASGYWYRGYYFYPDGTYRYNGGGGGPFGGRYTFKPLDRSGWGQSGITPRRRSAPGISGVTRVVSISDRSPTLTGRRPAPRSTSPAATTPARRRTPVTVPTDGRRVQPAGWGMTDGRRTVVPSPTPSGRRTPDSPAAQEPAGGRRTVPSGTPSSGGVDARRPTRTVEPSGQSNSSGETRRTAPTAPRPNAQPSTTRQPASRPNEGTSARRPPSSSSKSEVTPSARRPADLPAARRPVQTRAAPTQPSRSAPQARPAPTRAPRSAPRARPAPARSAPRAPVRSSAPRSRPSAPVSRPPARSAPAPRSAPSRSSGGRHHN